MRFEGKVALITGSSRGLGRALAVAFAREGARLVINGRDPERLAAVEREIAATGAEVLAVTADVSEEAEVDRLVRAALDRYSRIDILINNASILGPSPRPNLLDFTAAQVDEILHANVTAPWMVSKAVIPHMLDRGEGVVLNVTSEASLGYGGWGIYGVSKAALDVLTKTWADELEGTGVRVNAVDPGSIRTDMHQEAYAGEDISDRPEPDVAVPAFLYLASDAAREITGRRFEAQEFVPAQ
jgi:NAD(P)-dependent dehydrogenase (short-subunit alcohol dehydrogenase family)